MAENKFEMVLSGQNGDELVADFCDQIGFVWREYAQLSEEDLTNDAKALRRSLLNAFSPCEGDEPRTVRVTIEVCAKREG